MSENIFRTGYTEIFNEAHPAADGWVVFQEEKNSKLCSGWLPEFLKERHPEWIAKMVITKVVTEGKESAASLKGQEKIKLDSCGWVGAIEIKINGQELHYRASNDAVSNGMWISGEVVTLAAAKDTALLEQVYAELKQFSLEQDKAGLNVLVYDGTHFPKPVVSWNDLILPGTMAEDLKTSIAAFFSAGDRYKELGLAYKRGYIFAGPPGTGKTLAAKIIASNKSLAFVMLPHSKMGERGVVEQAFELAKQHAPAVLLLEDLDRLGHNSPAITRILNLMDDFEVTDGVLVITTVNDIHQMDPSMVHRPSRFDRIWEFPLPGAAQRLALLKKLGGKHFSEAAMEKAAAQSDGFSMAYVQEIFTNALLLAVSKGEDVNDGHLENSLTALKKQFKSSDAKEGLKAQRVSEGMGFKTD